MYDLPSIQAPLIAEAIQDPAFMIFADIEWLGVADHPDVPDNQKSASYLAAQRILDVVRVAKIDGPWGAFHLVTRVSKWLLLNPKPVNKWKKACFGQESGGG